MPSGVSPSPEATRVVSPYEASGVSPDVAVYTGAAGRNGVGLGLLAVLGGVALL